MVVTVTEVLGTEAPMVPEAPEADSVTVMVLVGATTEPETVAPLGTDALEVVTPEAEDWVLTVVLGRVCRVVGVDRLALTDGVVMLADVVFAEAVEGWDRETLTDDRLALERLAEVVGRGAEVVTTGVVGNLVEVLKLTEDKLALEALAEGKLVLGRGAEEVVGSLVEALKLPEERLALEVPAEDRLVVGKAVDVCTFEVVGRVEVVGSPVELAEGALAEGRLVLSRAVEVD